MTKDDLDKVRDIEGFPLGSDDDIIALSDPPFFTACPNPFIADFIQAHGKTFDEISDDYHREPYAADVSEGKSDPIYNYHTYHTKVPPKAILKYILHYTNPGDIIYDAFCGSGMTGVAAAMAKDKIYTENNSKTGVRYSILSDLSPAATFIAQGYNYPSKLEDVVFVANELLNWLKKDFGWAYETNHVGGNGTLIGEEKGFINYTVWSDILICPNCGEELNYYEVNVDKTTGHKKGNNLTCPKCNFCGKVPEFERAVDLVFDEILGKTIKTVKEKPVLINYTFGGKKFDKKPDEEDFATIEKIKSLSLSDWYPKNLVPSGFNTDQPKKSHFVEHVDLFYNKRSLIAFAKLWNRIENMDTPHKNILKFWLQTVSVGFTKTNRYFSSSFSQVNRYLKGTLYIAPIRSEVSPQYALIGKAKKLSTLISNPECRISCMSSEKSLIPDNSIDYIFIDPPFGANIMYSDLNIIWESWLKVRTQNKNEAIINTADNKDANFYSDKMLQILQDCRRVLKPNRWITIEFHNSKNEVWNILQSVIFRAGFIIADVRVLDKKVQTMKQYSTTNAVDKDLVISAYKPKEKLAEKFLPGKVTEETAWAFVRQHLENLPVTVKIGGKLDIISERRAFLLFDRMVAYHLVNGLSVPIDAGDFYRGLDERFSKRDEMYFLPNQVNEYDLARAEADLTQSEISLFVVDEKSAIDWLYSQLNPSAGGFAQSYQELQPKFMQGVKSVKKNEKLPELMTMLEENFLRDDSGRWYVPDLTKSGDIAKLREKNLLKEFRDYQAGKGKLKNFRSEAIRVGFKKLFEDGDYKSIVKFAERLPEETIQEDGNLLMIYDISREKI